MNITFYLDAKMNHNMIETKTVEVDSLDTNLVDLINSISTINHSHVSFGTYYSDTKLMNYRKRFPYIIKDGEYMWNVPFNEVSIKDFINTTGVSIDQTIQVQIDKVGGYGDDSSFIAIVTWIQMMWSLYGNDIQTIAFFADIFEKAVKIVKHFYKGKSLPEAKNVKEAVLKRKKWKKDDIKKALGFDSESLDLIMSGCGYKKDTDYYILDKDNHEIENDYLKIDCWKVKKRNDKYREISFWTHELNEALTCLKIQSEALNLECYNEIRKKTENFMKKTNNSLIKGEGLCTLDIDYNVLAFEQDQDDTFVDLVIKGLHSLYWEVDRKFNEINEEYCY